MSALERSLPQHETSAGAKGAPSPAHFSAHKRAGAYAAAVALCLFATLAAAVVAYGLVREDYPEYIQPFVSWLPASLAAGLAIMAVFSAGLGACLYFLLTRFLAVDAALTRLQPPRRFALQFTRTDVCKAGLVVLALWAPIVVIMYPTGLTVDTFNQLYQFQASAPTYYPTTETVVNAEFIDHHPVFDTLLYGLFWQLGAALGSQNAGLFALAALQSVVLSFEMGALVCYLSRIGVPFALRLASLVFIAWFPFFGHYASTVLKDTTYLTVFIPWMLMYVEAVRTRGEALRDVRYLVAFMLLGGMCILAKKLGVFVLVLSLAVLAARLRGARMRVAGGAIATVAVFCFALPAVVYPAIGGVAPGGPQEALGPAIQHVAALAHEDEDALGPDERQACNKVFDLNRAAEDYTPFSCDPAKSTYRASATGADIARFLGVWAAEGIKHPVIYLKSTALVTGMLFAPFLKLTYYTDENVYNREDDYRGASPDFNVNVQQPAALVELNNYLRFNSLECKLSDLPLVSLFFTEGFYGGWVPFIALALTLYARNMRRTRRGDGNGTAGAEAGGRPSYLTALAPCVITVLFLLVSPVSSPRYILPLLFTAPLMLGWAWHALACAHK